MRTHFTQLPNVEELKKILQAEAERDIPEQKKSVHYPDFSTVIALLETCGLDSVIFTQDYTPSDLRNSDVLEQTANALDRLASKILSEEEKYKKELNNLFDYLSQEDQLQSADLIFVFGSKQPFRTEKAVELFMNGLAPKVMISGGRSFYQKSDDPNLAREHAEHAASMGVPEEALIVEDKSITIPDNVKTSLNLLEQKDISHSTIILVNSPYAQRRGWAHFKKFTKPSTKLIRVNSEVTKLTAHDSWYKSDSGVKIILNEFFKMKAAVILNSA